MSKQHAHHDSSRRSRRRRTVALILVAALGLGWLAWNLLLVESDVASVAEEVQTSSGESGP